MRGWPFGHFCVYLFVFPWCHVWLILLCGQPGGLNWPFFPPTNVYVGFLLKVGTHYWPGAISAAFKDLWVSSQNWLHTEFHTCCADAGFGLETNTPSTLVYFVTPWLQFQLLFCRERVVFVLESSLTSHELNDTFRIMLQEGSSCFLGFWRDFQRILFTILKRFCPTSPPP